MFHNLLYRRRTYRCVSAICNACAAASMTRRRNFGLQILKVWVPTLGIGTRKETQAFFLPFFFREKMSNFWISERL